MITVANQMKLLLVGASAKSQSLISVIKRFTGDLFFIKNIQEAAYLSNNSEFDAVAVFMSADNYSSCYSIVKRLSVLGIRTILFTDDDVPFCESDFKKMNNIEFIKSSSPFFEISKQVQRALNGVKSNNQALNQYSGKASERKNAMPDFLFDENGHIKTFAEIEKDILKHALNHYQGRMSEVSRRLGIGRTTLYRKVANLDG